MTANADVQSANIVGFTTKAITPSTGFIMIGVQFKKTGGENETINIQDFVKMTNISSAQPSRYGRNSSNCVQIQVPRASGAGYDIYSYVTGLTGVEGAAWAKGTANAAASDEIKLGQGAWFVAPEGLVGDNASISVAGEVKTDVAKKSIDLVNGWNIIINPFPVALTTDMITLNGFTAESPNRYQRKSSNCSQMQVPRSTGAGYDIYSWIANATDSTDPCWAKGTAAGKYTGEIAGVGQGFWINTMTAGCSIDIDINAGKSN